MRVRRGDIGQCAACGRDIIRHSKAHIYCPDCSAERSKNRGRQWARENPLNETQVARRVAGASKRKSAAVEYGASISNERRATATWNAAETPEFAWFVRTNVPFSYAASKNHIYTMRMDGHVALRKEARAMRTALTLKISEALKTSAHQPVPGKLWIDILVQKPNHRGDAINVVDLVCDAIKDAMDVDDRWFAIRRLDWEIIKSDPRLWIGIGQTHTDPRRVCSYCGRALPLDAFTKNAKMELGVGRECRQCTSLGKVKIDTPDDGWDYGDEG